MYIERFNSKITQNMRLMYFHSHTGEIELDKLYIVGYTVGKFRFTATLIFINTLKYADHLLDKNWRLTCAKGLNAIHG